MSTHPLCLSLEFDFEGERVTGRLADEKGNHWAFSCWLDLLTLIERVLDGEMNGLELGTRTTAQGRTRQWVGL